MAAGSNRYFFIRNVQNDIVAVIDANGTEVVRYEYDAWGNPISTTGTFASTIGKRNPFRYRGYYWDEETGMYYLQSRYYDPEIRRFISPDSIVNKSLAGTNLYEYCTNNPINMYDPSGNIPWSWHLGPIFIPDPITRIKNLARMAGKPIDVSIDMFMASIFGNKKRYHFTGQDDLGKLFLHSGLMNSRLQSFYNRFVASGKLQDTFPQLKSEELLDFGNDGMNSYDVDLHYSVGHASYEVTFVDFLQADPNLAPFLPRYIAKVKVEDTYDFKYFDDPPSFTTNINNFGYFMQEIGVVKKYDWDLVYYVPFTKTLISLN